MQNSSIRSSRTSFDRLLVLVLACLSIATICLPAAGPASAQTPCEVRCIRVESIDPYYTDVVAEPYAGGYVWLTDETGSYYFRRSTVHGLWTYPDGTQVTQDTNVSIRRRAHFKIYPPEPGVYTLEILDVTPSDLYPGYTFDPANSVELSTSIDVTPPNAFPIAIARADPTFGAPPLTVHFDSSESYDPDGEIIAYQWDFGDGTMSTEADPTHVFTDAGTYDASLFVIDDGGRRSLTGSVVMVSVGDGTTSCEIDCARVGSIELDAKTRRRSTTIRARIEVVDERGAGISDAQVYVSWTLPDGSILDQVATSRRRKGIASFYLESAGAGEYTVSVNDIRIGGLAFDPDNSDQLQESIVVSE